MCECIPADDRFGILDRVAGVPGYRLGDLAYLGELHCRYAVIYEEQHGHLFQRGIARSLPQAVHAYVNLGRSRLHRSYGVGGRQPHVVVAVHCYRHLHGFGDLRYQELHGTGGHHSHRIRDVYQIGTGLRHAAVYLLQEVQVASGGVLA
ncbi:hypothetical protein SDC9_209326 [bioreactor metagenome]|uniref:Uncharacterized protein n=1 Tax=bioreactor metagenome TaxID=1076179 RepID=A0A645JD17_9ZZZZ